MTKPAEELLYMAYLYTNELLQNCFLKFFLGSEAEHSFVVNPLYSYLTYAILKIGFVGFFF